MRHWPEALQHWQASWHCSTAVLFSTFMTMFAGRALLWLVFVRLLVLFDPVTRIDAQDTATTGFSGASLSMRFGQAAFERRGRLTESTASHLRCTGTKGSWCIEYLEQKACRCTDCTGYQAIFLLCTVRIQLFNGARRVDGGNLVHPTSLP